MFLEILGLPFHYKLSHNLPIYFYKNTRILQTKKSGFNKGDNRWVTSNTVVFRRGGYTRAEEWQWKRQTGGAWSATSRSSWTMELAVILCSQVRFPIFLQIRRALCRVKHILLSELEQTPTSTIWFAADTKLWTIMFISAECGHVLLAHKIVLPTDRKSTRLNSSH